MRSAYVLLVRNPEVKRPLGRHKYRWKDNTDQINKAHGGWALADRALTIWFHEMQKNY
jgi:hypothetical protein